MKCGRNLVSGVTSDELNSNHAICLATYKVSQDGLRKSHTHKRQADGLPGIARGFHLGSILPKALTVSCSPSRLKPRELQKASPAMTSHVYSGRGRNARTIFAGLSSTASSARFLFNGTRSISVESCSGASEIVMSSSIPGILSSTAFDSLTSS